MNSADLCRQNGWGVGDVLEVTDPPDAKLQTTERWRITAIGERNILAVRLGWRTVAVDGEKRTVTSDFWGERYHYEACPYLACKDVKRVEVGS